MHVKTDQFAETAKKALNDTYTRLFLDGMHEKVKERLKSIGRLLTPLILGLDKIGET